MTPHIVAMLLAQSSQFWNQPAQPTTINGSISVMDGGVFLANQGAPGASAWPVSFSGTVDVGDRSGRLLGHVAVDSMPSVAVTGTFWQATQPVSAASLPLPAGAALEGGNLATIASAVSGGAQQVRVTNPAKPPAVNPLTGAAKVDGSGALQPVLDSAVLAQLVAEGATMTNGSQVAQIGNFPAVQYVQQNPGLPLPPCNPVRRLNCQRW